MTILASIKVPLAERGNLPIDSRGPQQEHPVIISGVRYVGATGDVMATKHDLQDWVQHALTRIGGRGTLTDVAKEIWRAHESDLRASGDLFFTWQYDMRWAANRLRRLGIMRSVTTSPAGLWVLVKMP